MKKEKKGNPPAGPGAKAETYWMPVDASGFWPGYASKSRKAVISELRAYDVPWEMNGLRIVKVEIRKVRKARAK